MMYVDVDNNFFIEPIANPSGVSCTETSLLFVELF